MDETKLNIPDDALAIAQSELHVEKRIRLARSVGAQRPTDLSDWDSQILKRLLDAIVNDAETRVRRALAETLAENPEAPREIVLRLVRDVDVVAVPLLRISEVLSPTDLVTVIVKKASEPKMTAIAGRANVPDEVASALIEHGTSHTIETLLHNNGADISEHGLTRIVDLHGNEERIQGAILDRQSLPPSLIERLISLLSSELLSRMMERHKVSKDFAAKIALETQNRATLALIVGLSQEAIAELIDDLSKAGRLTPSLFLRALCEGNLDFLSHVIALRTLLGAEYVRNHLATGSIVEVEQFWRNAGLPAKLLPVVRVLVETLAQARLRGSNLSPSDYRWQMSQRLGRNLEETFGS
jgi:uncharacterized protein (DUF2336 family)